MYCSLRWKETWKHCHALSARLAGEHYLHKGQIYLFLFMGVSWVWRGGWVAIGTQRPRAKMFRRVKEKREEQKNILLPSRLPPSSLETREQPVPNPPTDPPNPPSSAMWPTLDPSQGLPWDVCVCVWSPPHPSSSKHRCNDKKQQSRVCYNNHKQYEATVVKCKQPERCCFLVKYEPLQPKNPQNNDVFLQWKKKM